MPAKRRLLINRHQIGYLPMGGAKMRSSNVNQNTRHDLNEALFIRRERTQDDPDVVAEKPLARPEPVARRPARVP
jgi:hypothetical protein